MWMGADRLSWLSQEASLNKPMGQPVHPIQTDQPSQPDLSFSGAVGVFDSGVGGLSVLRSIRNLLPAIDLVYVADSLHAPYGEQSEAFIKERTLSLGLALERAGVKAIVVACNTATVLAVKALRAQTQLPVVAIEPAIKPAVLRTQSGVVGVLATTQTTQSQSVQRLCELYGANTKILLQPCPGLVEWVESGLNQSDEAHHLLSRYIEPLIDQGADTLVLGCTHYSFLKDLIQKIVGTGVELIDPADAVARELERRLAIQPLGNKKDVDFNNCSSITKKDNIHSQSLGAMGSIRLFTTGNLSQAQVVMPRLWGEDIEIQKFN